MWDYWGNEDAGDLSAASAAGHSEAMAEEHDMGDHEDRPRASCWLCQEGEDEE